MTAKKKKVAAKVEEPKVLLAEEDAVEVMNQLHVDIGHKAAELALSVLDTVNPKDMSVASAVSLLKFGVELERKALLGVEEDAAESDPFEALIKTMNQKPDAKDGE